MAGRIARGIALIPEDRKALGTIQIMSVRENMSLASLADFTRGFHLNLAAEAARVRDFVRELAIKVASPENPISALSGGNQQKVVIGKALMTRPKVLLMDEPSRGIDVGAKAEVFRTMRRLAAEGLGILFVTSDLEEVMSLSDRILVMSNGRITGEFAARSRGRGGHRRRLGGRTCAGRRGGDARMSSDANALAAPGLGGDSALLLLLKARTFIALIAVFVFFALAAPNFLSAANMVILAKHVALNAILAIGMTFVIITGGIDLSVGSIVGLCGHGRGLPGAARDRPRRSRHRLYALVQHLRDHRDRAPRRRRGRRGQRAPDHPAERRAVHRDARHALRGARARAALLGRRAPSRT